MLSQSPEVSLYDLSSLKVLVTGSSLLSSTIRVEVMDRIPSLRYVRESYGLNECGLVTLTYPRDAKKSSASSSSAGGELKNNQTKFHHIHGTLKLLLAIDKVRPQGFFSLLWHTHQAVLKYFAYFSFVVFLWPLTTTENQECIRDSWRGSGSEGWSNSSLFVLVWAALASTMAPSSYSFLLVVSAADVPDDHVMPVGLPNMYTQVRSLLALKSWRIFIMCP